MKKSQKFKLSFVFLTATSLVTYCFGAFFNTLPSSGESLRVNQNITSQIIPMRLLKEEEKAEIRRQSSTIILFGRHGTTESNFSGKTHNKGSGELISSALADPETVSQFRELRQYIRKVYSSPDERSKMTACLLCIEDDGSPQPFSLRPKFINSLREQDFGSLSGKGHVDYLKDPEFFALLSDESYRMSGGGETLEEVTNRVLKSIEKCFPIDETDYSTTFFASNRGCMFALEKYISGLQFNIPKGSLPSQETKEKIIKLYNIPNYSMLIFRYYNDSHVIDFLEEKWYEMLVSQGLESELHTQENKLYSPKEALNILKIIDSVKITTISQEQLFLKAKLLSECMSPISSPTISPVTSPAPSLNENVFDASSSVKVHFPFKCLEDIHIVSQSAASHSIQRTNSSASLPKSPLQATFSSLDEDNITKMSLNPISSPITGAAFQVKTNTPVSS